MKATWIELSMSEPGMSPPDAPAFLRSSRSISILSGMSVTFSIVASIPNRGGASWSGRSRRENFHLRTETPPTSSCVTSVMMWARYTRRMYTSFAARRTFSSGWSNSSERRSTDTESLREDAMSVGDSVMMKSVRSERRDIRSGFRNSWVTPDATRTTSVYFGPWRPARLLSIVLTSSVTLNAGKRSGSDASERSSVSTTPLRCSIARCATIVSITGRVSSLFSAMRSATALSRALPENALSTA
mmetsp:Transcript_40106/g.95124  ORF Transcript_40106/g.95124 Transcript_40106/m.95124 type:complete len:244 (+) Transcript_40106:3164-3895(+)